MRICFWKSEIVVGSFSAGAGSVAGRVVAKSLHSFCAIFEYAEFHPH